MRFHLGLPFFAVIIASSALGLLSLGVLALGRSVDNAEAAAAQDLRKAALAGIRALRARVESPGFAKLLPENERITVSADTITAPAALRKPGPHPDPGPELVTQSALARARRLEFVERRPLAARASLDEALLRPDMSEQNRALLRSTAIWIARRQKDTKGALAYRQALDKPSAWPESCIASIALFDFVEQRAWPAQLETRIALLPNEVAEALLARLTDLAHTESQQRALEALRARLHFVRKLRHGLALLRSASEDLRSTQTPALRGQAGETASVIVWLPSPEKARSGNAWFLELPRVEQLLFQASGSSEEPEQTSPFTLVCGRAPENSIPVYPGLHAIPHARAQGSSSALTMLVLLVLTLTLTLGLWLMLRSFKHERQALAQRSEFLRSITHELRTPLASIRLFAETLVSGRASDADKRREYTQILAVEAGRLSTLVENALELGRTERGERSWSFEETRLDELGAESIALFEPLATEAGMTIDFDARAVTVSADRDGLRQVLWNLFENARKYAGAGCQLLVCITATQKHAEIRVRDSGPGIPEHEREQIFERFVRGSAQADGSTPGAGLGLAIARSIIQAHDGTIALENRPGSQGAAFLITLARSHENKQGSGS